MSPKRFFLIILIVYLGLAVGYAVVMPLGEAPDEADHYAYVVYLGQNRHLPEGPMVTQGKHPPLYHATAAALTAWTGLDFDFLRSNPDALPLEPGKPPNFFVHTTLESFPWRSGALAMHLARFLSVLLGAITVWATWRLGMEVFPDRPAIGLLAAAFLAGLPGFLFISGSLSNDNAAGAFGALAILLCAMTMRRGLSSGRTALLGVVLGLGLLSKVGVLALWPLVALAVGGAWWTADRPRRSLPLLAGHLALAWGIGLLIASPWLLRNWRLYGDPLAWDLVRATVDQRLAPFTLADIGWLLRGFHTSFWGRFAAAGQVVLPTGAFALAVVFTAVVTAGGVWYVASGRRPVTRGRWQGAGEQVADGGWQVAGDERPIDANHAADKPIHQPTPLDRSPIPDPRLRSWLLLTLLAVAPILVFLSIVRYSAIALGTDQVRLMWPALAALAVWVGVGVVGVVDWSRERRGKGRKEGKRGAEERADGLLVAGWILAMATFGLVVLLAVIRPAFAPPEPVVATSANTPEVLARFAGLELVGVELPAQPLAAGEPVPVRLLWRAAAPLADDLRPTVRLVHQDGWLAAEWSHAPAGGRYSTDRWQPGEVIADDYLLAPQPVGPGLYTVEVGVRPFGGDWLQANGKDIATSFAVLGQIVYR
jgi:4-amino-4-deoxy-L-arabinose transferase-like glycosyltransferase